MASNVLEMDSTVAEFCSITGAVESIGRHLVEACGGNLEMAVSMHLDGAGSSVDGVAGTSVGGRAGTSAPSPAASTSTNTTSRSQASASTDTFEDDVRAPIPQKTECLVEDGPTFGFRSRRGRRAGRSVFDSFRDFQAETRQQELRLSGRGGSGHKRKTLEDLFRPPIELLYKGSFHEAKEEGTAANKWLLVNIQNVKEFACQVLNRDVWSSPAVKDILGRHFVFWQVYSDSEEGTKFMQFYKVTKWPFIAVLDPRTGECMMSWVKMDAMSFCDLVGEFLAEHPNPDRVTSPALKKARLEESIVDATEDHQLEAAIQASLRPAAVTTISLSSDSQEEEEEEEEDDDLETFSDSDEELFHRASAPKRGGSGVTSIETKSGRTCADLNGKPATSSSKSSSDIIPSSTTTSDFEQESDSLHSSTTGSRRTTPTEEKAISLGAAVTEEAVSLGAAVTEEAVSLGAAVTEEAVSLGHKWQDYLGDETDEQTKLLVRYPDGKRDQLTMPCSSKLKALVVYVETKGYQKGSFELVTNFPRQSLSSLDVQITLKDAGLHPQQTVFIQES